MVHKLKAQIFFASLLRVPKSLLDVLRRNELIQNLAHLFHFWAAIEPGTFRLLRILVLSAICEYIRIFSQLFDSFGFITQPIWSLKYWYDYMIYGTISYIMYVLYGVIWGLIHSYMMSYTWLYHILFMIISCFIHDYIMFYT